MTKASGFNMLSLGILHETALRWVPPVARVQAYASKLIPTRLDHETGKPARVGTPDSVQVLTVQEDGSCGTYRLSGVFWHETGMGIALHGSEGTLIYDLTATRSAAPGAPSPRCNRCRSRSSCTGAGASSPTSSPRSAASAR
jgi:hypothetical protein